MYAEEIHRVGTTPFVSQGLQTRDINACVVLDFKANTAKVLTHIYVIELACSDRTVEMLAFLFLNLERLTVRLEVTVIYFPIFRQAAPDFFRV